MEFSSFILEYLKQCSAGKSVIGPMVAAQALLFLTLSSFLKTQKQQSDCFFTLSLSAQVASVFKDGSEDNSHNFMNLPPDSPGSSHPTSPFRVERNAARLSVRAPFRPQFTEN